METQSEFLNKNAHHPSSATRHEVSATLIDEHLIEIDSAPSLSLSSSTSLSLPLSLPPSPPSQGSLSTCQLSEPLLWFILRVLDTSEALKAFHDMGEQLPLYPVLTVL